VKAKEYNSAKRNTRASLKRTPFTKSIEKSPSPLVAAAQSVAAVVLPTDTDEHYVRGTEKTPPPIEFTPYERPPIAPPTKAKRLQLPPQLANYVPKNPGLMAYLSDTSRHPKDLLTRRPPGLDYEYLYPNGRLKPSRIMPRLRAQDPADCIQEIENCTRDYSPDPAIDSDGSLSDGDPPVMTLELINKMRKAAKEVHAQLNEPSDKPRTLMPTAGIHLYPSIAYQDERPCRRIFFRRCFATEHLDYFLTHVNVQEDGFLARPAIKLPIPDRIKAILVDDWENVTKNQQLVPLPVAFPVDTILRDYEAEELPRRTPGSPEASILEEMVAGLREYFDKCLGRILLYR
jgi:hypothetical protein